MTEEEGSSDGWWTDGLSSETLDEHLGVGVDEEVLEGVIVVGRRLGGSERPTEGCKVRTEMDTATEVSSTVEPSHVQARRTSSLRHRRAQSWIRGEY